MNICYISNSAAPSKNASSLQTAKLCEELSRQGHKINLILPKTGELNKNYFNFYNIKYKFRIIRLENFKEFPVGFNYYLFSFFSIMASNFKNQNLFITRNFFTSFLLSVLNKKHLFEVHDDILIEGRIIRFLVKYIKILNFASVLKVITTTDSLKKRYANYGIKKEKIHILHNASSLRSKFKKYSKFKKKLNIGYFGSIYQSRGIEIILKISHADQKNNYIIYGGDKKEIDELKKKYRNKNLFLHSHISYSKIKKELDKIDICILPYTKKITVSGNVGDISKYTSPLKVFDYMKMGKLIICSNLPVLREILNHNSNCLLVNKYENINEWLKKINTIKQNLKKFNKIRFNAYNYANKFNIHWRVKKILTFYN